MLKLCLLKEITSKYNYEQIKKLPELLSYIMEILKNGYISDEIKKEEIKKVLEKMKGSNIVNFSKYVNECVNQTELKILKQFLGEEDLEKITDVEKRLSKYNEYMALFEKDFEERKKNSFFEFAIVSLVLMEREDFQIF